MRDIIVCGSNTVDSFLKTDADLVSFDSPEHSHKLIAFPVGTKLPINELEFHIGGGGTNVCATFAKNNLQTAYIGRVGKDTSGHKVFEWLKKNKIEFLGQVGGRTGFSVILDTKAQDRTILAFKGANNELAFSEIPQHELETRWFYGCAMRGQSHETLEKLFVFMSNHGVKTAYNPNPIVAQLGVQKLKTILEHTHVLILNKEEAESLVGSGDEKSMAKQLHKHGPKIIAITNGDEGVYVSGEESFNLKPRPTRTVKETTGAGDAFASGFVTGLVQGKPLRKAAKMGLLNAESVIAHFGTKNVLSHEDMERGLHGE